MMELSELKAIYDAYGEALAQAHRKSSIFSGFFGQRSADDPRSHPCNRDFYEKTGDWISRFAASAVDEQRMLEVSRFVLNAAVNNEGRPTYWYFLVSQEYITALVPRMMPESCADLAAEYDRNYPKRRRLPIQDRVYEQLSRRALSR